MIPFSLITRDEMGELEERLEEFFEYCFDEMGRGARSDVLRWPTTCARCC